MAKRKNPHAAALGRLGGQAASDRKGQAARENGKAGGRPRKWIAAWIGSQANGSPLSRLALDLLDDPKQAFNLVNRLALHLTIELEAHEDGSRGRSKAAKQRYQELLRLGRALVGIETLWEEDEAAGRPTMAAFLRPSPLTEREPAEEEQR